MFNTDKGKIKKQKEKILCLAGYKEKNVSMSHSPTPILLKEKFQKTWKWL